MDSSSRTTLWAFLLIAGFFVVAFVLHRLSDGGKSAEDDYIDVEFLDKIAAESPSLSFGPEDVVVTHRWSVLSGISPAVTFRCRFDSPRKEKTIAVLCYRPTGSSEWLMADTRLRRDNSASIILRDLRRKTSYECFFILTGKTFLVRSQVVVFSTR
jgi:hypothetical protein